MRITRLVRRLFPYHDVQLRQVHGGPNHGERSIVLVNKVTKARQRMTVADLVARINRMVSYRPPTSDARPRRVSVVLPSRRRAVHSSPRKTRAGDPDPDPERIRGWRLAARWFGRRLESAVRAYVVRLLQGGAR